MVFVFGLKFSVFVICLGGLFCYKLDISFFCFLKWRCNFWVFDLYYFNFFIYFFGIGGYINLSGESLGIIFFIRSELDIS